MQKAASDRHTPRADLLRHHSKVLTRNIKSSEASMQFESLLGTREVSVKYIDKPAYRKDGKL